MAEKSEAIPVHNIIQKIEEANEEFKLVNSNIQLKRDVIQIDSLYPIFNVFILKQKIEKAKELLFYKQLTLSEIAFQMNYSSTAHLSSQFKKETGMTPTEIKEIRKPGHKSLDSL